LQQEWAWTNDNPEIAGTPAISTILGFVDGHWRDAPQREQINYPNCLAEDGSVGPGSDTAMITWSMEPQADGTLHGILTTTRITNRCGLGGVVNELPFVATRVGDVPTGVTVADPTTVKAPQLTNPTPPGPGPVLEGVYRIDLDFQSQTINGSPVTKAFPNRSEWWAFRSACDTTRCVAAGAQLAPGNLHQNTGIAIALDFREGRWQDTPPSVQPPEQCSNGPDADVSTVSWSLIPQLDGPIRGVGTRTILTDQCGHHGNVYKTPIVGERTGDVPATVVIADPTLLLTPQ
jgi:serine/threonine-protein kinase